MKYLVISDKYGETRVTEIKNDDEINEWLNDGSFDVGDIIYEVTRKRVIREKRSLYIEEEAHKQ